VHDSKAPRHDQQLDRGKDLIVSTPAEVYEAALAWYRAGFCVIPPVTTGRKAPLGVWKDYQAERPTAATMRLWYDHGPDDQYGVGLLTGQVSGNLEMLELEGIVQNDADFMVRIENAIAEADTFEHWSLVDLWESLHNGYHEFTPSGGLHLLYRISDHPAPGNQKIARRPKDPADYTDKDRRTLEAAPAAVIMETLIETRGEGGYVIVAPSQGPVHPTGNPWVIGYGCEAGRVPTITWEQREALVAALAAFDVPRPRVMKPLTTPPPRFPRAGTPATREGVQVGTDFNERARWDDILIPHGWTFHHIDGDVLYWERPGGSSTGGHSASTGYDPSHDRLWVFSTATVFPAEESITKFAAFTTLFHNGDWKAATRDLASQGYGEQRTLPSKPQTFGSLPVPDPRPASMLKHVDIDTDPEPMVEGQTSTLPGGPYEVQPPPSRVYLPPPGRESYTDMGTANRFIREHPQRFIFVAGAAEWRWFDGVIWQVDHGTVRVNHAVEMLLERMADEGQTLSADPEKAAMGKELAKYVKTARNNSGRKGLLATIAVKATVNHRDLDPHRHLLGLKNAVLDTRDGSVLRPDPAYLITRQMDVAYDPTAAAPQTREYMATMLPEAGLREFTQRAIGYTMTGEQDQRAFVIAHGPRGSGKSQFVELWGHMFGDYGTVAADAAFRKRERGTSGPSAELHALQGYRFVWASESDEDVVFDADIVKRICGGESMSTRTLYGKPEKWRPECVVWLATNNFPRFPADEEAVWDRVKPVSFEGNFDRDGSGMVRVLSISEKLFREEAPGILNLMIEWLKTYREQGWMEPDTLLGAIDSKKVEGDPVAQFWTEQVESMEIVEDAESEILAANLYNAYKHWSEETLGQRPRGSRRFFATLRVLLKYQALRKSHGKTYLPGWKKMNYNGVMGTMTGLG
jgi:P4 family phage/plasmid primase-like protien